ncbi:MAG TPA: hypothetical protein VIM41_16620 [Gammaproteobacteria bacterium]
MSEETVEIDIQEDMEVSQRSWLVTKLEQEQGIIGAWFAGGDHHRLTVHYERGHFSHVTLLDTIKEHGFHGEIVGA